MRCGEHANCEKTFTFEQTKYYAQCGGLTGAVCGGTADIRCDSLAGFFCAEWKKGDTGTPRCALRSDCDQTIGDEKVSCEGVEGDACTSNNGTKGCDPALGLKCAEDFSTSTF